MSSPTTPPASTVNSRTNTIQESQPATPQAQQSTTGSGSIADTGHPTGAATSTLLGTKPTGITKKPLEKSSRQGVGSGRNISGFMNYWPSQTGEEHEGSEASQGRTDASKNQTQSGRQGDPENLVPSMYLVNTNPNKGEQST